MMGSAPPHVLAGKRVGGYLRNKIKLKPFKPMGPVSFEAAFGCLVGRALVRGGHAPALIEFRRGDDWEDWQDPRKIYGSLSSGANAGLGGKVINQAAMGGRLARDLNDYIRNRPSYTASAEVDNFKLTPSSRNTARITVGPERRERRKKYEWEKVETQRKIQKAVLAVTIPAAVAAGGFLHKKGGGSIVRGIKEVSKEGYSKGRDIISAIKVAATGKGYFKPRAGSAARTTAQQRADKVAAAAADNIVEPDQFRKKPKK